MRGLRGIFFIGVLVLLILGISLAFFLNTSQNGSAILPSNPVLTPILSNEKERIGPPVAFSALLPSGFEIGVFAEGLDGARDLEILPDDTLLVTSPVQGKVFALTDRDRDARADRIVTILSGLNRPHGVVFHNEKLFVAEETKVSRYYWDGTNYKATFDKVLFQIPAGGQHFTRTLAIDPNGRMFVTIGSTCDVCFEKHPFLAAIIVSDAHGNTPRVFAKGLRNSVFITVNPATGELWGTDMGRDHLGDDLPPDEINILKEGGDYGWPICYGNKVYDRSFGQKSASYCEQTELPIYNIVAHSAPLGLTFIDSKQFPPDWQEDILVAYHGSWNRSTPIGYKVVRMNVEGNKIVSEEDFLTGFLPTTARQGSDTLGRPVDVEFDSKGSLYISDDKAGVVYKVVKK